MSDLGTDAPSDASSPFLDTLEDAEEDGRFRPQWSRATRKAKRPSRPATVLESMDRSARNLYFVSPPTATDLSYTAPRSALRGRKPKPVPSVSTELLPEPVSLYSILARYLQHLTEMATDESTFQYTPRELEILQNRGYTVESVQRWASCLTEPRSTAAVKCFEQGVEIPPLFLLLLFLRRKHIRVPALGIVMRHVGRIAQSESISWSELKIITTRLLRHGRELWPESMPWTASFFVAEASRLCDDFSGSNPLSLDMLSDLTQFCNTFLLLLSLPTSARPVVFAAQQEKAQFQILQYMASRSPAITVTRLGFRSVARNQLAHAKTLQEREWAELKGPTWPPWKENRTAMDEDKGYEFGASRASQLLHRMYEAGYSGRLWEDVAQVYAGWDTDSSPTIQTRTSLPRISSQYRDAKHLRPLLWAGRIRTTRTRREAWACFLSHELSGEPAHPDIYLAMFEKLYHAEAERSTRTEFSSDAENTHEEDTTHMLPGDMKEAVPDPLSTLHYVYLSEPVPGYRGLLGRMQMAHVKPKRRLLAFLLETCPEFDTGLGLLDMARDIQHGRVGRMLDGIHDQYTSGKSIPGFLFKAIIDFLCRFGSIDQSSFHKVDFLPPEQHVRQLRSNRQYCVEYAYMLLKYYRPIYRPAWACMIKVLASQKGHKHVLSLARYKLICSIVEDMEEIDLDVDDEIFRLVCIATMYAAQAVERGSASFDDTRHVLSTASSRLRTLFNGLVGASADVQSPTGDQTANVISPHIPGPAELHAYVRGLGILRDYEGLYSFTTWFTKHHAEVTARAEAQRSGRHLLFKTLVALRLAVDGGGFEPGNDHTSGAPEDIALLIKTQIESVEHWGGWPAKEYVDMYAKGHLKSAPPVVGGR
ncbi:uncharacterized protein J4E92_008603 [Alternaria infectoria]|uniref:uncharacterized protein n=1 Tax=Alternaria infectoria TaxID=45303 RepID=UPI0022203C16|nr:uncharacterized protein J4E92_008603 [Alternaria infectoria]KAI4920384.1 hypothetical protein J4E92_008603 [Alternaria infectoria]